MTDKIPSNTPVIDHNSRQLNNTNETTPATGAKNPESQLQIEQATTAQELQANVRQEIPNIEIQNRAAQTIYQAQSDMKSLWFCTCKKHIESLIELMNEVARQDLNIAINFFHNSEDLTNSSSQFRAIMLDAIARTAGESVACNILSEYCNKVNYIPSIVQCIKYMIIHGNADIVGAVFNNMDPLLVAKALGDMIDETKIASFLAMNVSHAAKVLLAAHDVQYNNKLKVSENLLLCIQREIADCSNYIRAMTKEDPEKTSTILQSMHNNLLKDLFTNIKINDIAEIFNDINPCAALKILDILTEEERLKILSLMDPKSAGNVLLEMETKKVIDLLLDVRPGIASKIFLEMEIKKSANIISAMNPTDCVEIVCCRGAESFVDIFCEMNPARVANILCASRDKYLIKSVDILSAITRKNVSKAAETVTKMSTTNVSATNAIFLNMGSIYVANIIGEMDPEVAAKVILAKVPNAIAEILSLMAPKKAADILGKMDKVMSEEIISKMRPAKAAAIRQEIEKTQSK